MGPAMAGAAGRRAAPRSNFTPVMPQGPGGASRLGAGLTQTTAPTLGVKKEGQDVALGKQKKVEEDEAEVYSDPDEGVEIIDMENVRTMDWMAPEALRKQKETKKKKLKIEEQDKKEKGTLPPATTQMSSNTIASCFQISES